MKSLDIHKPNWNIFHLLDIVGNDHPINKYLF